MRAALIGAGRMGRRHIQALQELGLEVAGVFDRDARSLALAAKERCLQQAQLFSDAETMLLETAPECVVVATTTESHGGFTCAAARNGARYVLCEKPMAESLAQCDEMIAVCRENGTRLAINHHFRCSELHQSVKCMLQSDSLGGLRSVTVVAGNVGMAMIGTHLFELFHFITGEAPHEITAWLTPAVDPNPRGAQFVDPGGSIRITTARGTRFFLEAGVDQGHGITVVYGARHGQIVLDLLRGSVRITRRRDEERIRPTTQYGTCAVEETAEYPPADGVRGTKALLDRLLSGGDIPTGMDGRQAVAVLIAGYVSNENGHRPVRLAEGTLPAGRIFPWP